MILVIIGRICIGDRFVNMPDEQTAARQAGIIAGELAVFNQEELACARILAKFPVYAARIGAQQEGRGIGFGLRNGLVGQGAADRGRGNPALIPLEPGIWQRRGIAWTR